jgi:hypothetical protein
VAKAPKPNKFESLTKDDLLRLVLEQEDELEKWRPKPPKYKLGQVLVSTKTKHPYWTGQTAVYFQVISLECRGGKWHYGYARTNTQGIFHSFSEETLRELTQAELTGTTAPAAPQPTMAEASGVIQNSAPMPMPTTGEVGQLVGFDFETPEP